MTTLRLPGLIDPHVHVRDLRQSHKEDWASCTAAALAGGITTILAMPNTQPPITDEATLTDYDQAAVARARCDYGINFGASETNAPLAATLAPRCSALKLYLDATFGPLLLDGLAPLTAHFTTWPRPKPILAHAEERTLAALLFFAELYDRPVHICHVSRRAEIELIAQAKARGIQVTCEVCPHHLFLTQNGLPAKNFPALGPRHSPLHGGYREVRPRLATQTDVDALWAHLDMIDCFATDHAPHTLAEKDFENPPPGFPGLETALPLLLTAVHERRLTLDDLIKKMHTNPKRIFNLPDQPETWVEVDEDATYEIRAAEQFTRCGWTPFEGWQVQGRVRKVVLRGQVAFEDGKVLAEKGLGRNVRG